jgi:hypothetical protein
MRIHIAGLLPSGIEKCVIVEYCRKDFEGTWYYFGESIWGMGGMDTNESVGPEVISEWIEKFQDWHKNGM